MLCLNIIITVSVHCVNTKILFALSLVSILCNTCIFCYRIDRRAIKEMQTERLPQCKADIYSKFSNRRDNRPQKLKYILHWTKSNNDPTPLLKRKQEAFLQNNCFQKNCFTTKNRSFFGGSLKKFDAIVFNGRNLNKNDIPSKIYQHQKLIFMNTESAARFPVCAKSFDNFFNWTFTYKLNSDIFFIYFQVKNVNSKIVGPKRDMEWNYNNISTDDEVDFKWTNKNIAVAWMVSNCRTLNHREKLVKKIDRELKKYHLKLDIYGSCGTRVCSKNDTWCWTYIENNYYFYLAFENSHAVDYVTEKVLYPLQHFTIPIVYGGANYSRFLPPGSYLDASRMSVPKLVSLINKIIKSKTLYKKYFSWRKYYTYEDGMGPSLCRLCAALHNETKMKRKKIYKKFRKWWLPSYQDTCMNFSRKFKRFSI